MSQYNTTYKTVAKMSPFKALYKYEPPSLKAWILQNFKVLIATKSQQEMQNMLAILKDNLTLEFSLLSNLLLQEIIFPQLLIIWDLGKIIRIFRISSFGQ